MIVEHDIRFLSAAFLYVQLLNTTLWRLQRRFLAPLFQIFDPIFYIKLTLKNGEIWRGEGGAQIWHSRSLGDFNASVANVLQTSCESE